jgi:hypothetical protein
MDLLYGIDLTHFSNGRTFRPNAGLNMFGFNVGFRYHFNATQNRVDNSIHPQTLLEVRPELTIFRTVEQVRSGRILIYSAGGLVQNSEDMGTRKQYSTHSHLIEYQYQFNTRSAVTAGLDFFMTTAFGPGTRTRGSTSTALTSAMILFSGNLASGCRPGRTSMEGDMK